VQAAAPLNPSDMGFMRAKARGTTYPAVCGNEGSGTVRTLLRTPTALRTPALSSHHL
jgi:hypothetical protein